MERAAEALRPAFAAAAEGPTAAGPTTMVGPMAMVGPKAEDLATAIEGSAAGGEGPWRTRGLKA